MSTENPSIPPTLLASKIAAVLLGLYALFYAVLLLIVVVDLSNDTDDMLLVIALLAMATTPFFAFMHLLRASRANPKKPVRPILMAVVMAAPAVYWLYIAFGDLRFSFYSWDDFQASMMFAGIPGLLSAWIMGTFVWLAVQKYRTPSQD